MNKSHLFTQRAAEQAIVCVLNSVTLMGLSEVSIVKKEMTMIIWSGLGFLVALITFLFLLVAEYASESLFGDASYFQNHGWPKLMAFFISGVLVWLLGSYLNNKQGKVMIEKETGQEFFMKPNHSLFFIRMEYWGPILLILGIIALFV